jgi:hypothetical protein
VQYLVGGVNSSGAERAVRFGSAGQDEAVLAAARDIVAGWSDATIPVDAQVKNHARITVEAAITAPVLSEGLDGLPRYDCGLWGAQLAAAYVGFEDTDASTRGALTGQVQLILASVAFSDPGARPKLRTDECVAEVRWRLARLSGEGLLEPSGIPGYPPHLVYLGSDEDDGAPVKPRFGTGQVAGESEPEVNDDDPELPPAPCNLDDAGALVLTGPPVFSARPDRTSETLRAVAVHLAAAAREARMAGSVFGSL